LGFSSGGISVDAMLPFCFQPLGIFFSLVLALERIEIDRRHYSHITISDANT
jgi:hypothetical protein